MRILYSTDDIARVLVIIHDVVGSIAENNIKKPRNSIPNKKETPDILHIGTIQDTRLEQYLRDRCIPIDLARIYLKEVCYRVDARKFSSLAFENDSGGFEVRNAAFKGTL